MKNKLLAIVLISAMAFCANADEQIDSGEKLVEIAPVKLADGVYTPAFIQYFQKSRPTPSCSLLKDGKRVDVIAFDEDSTDSYSNCNKIYPPIVAKVNGIFYASYKYLEEETRGHIAPGFVTIQIGKDKFSTCLNDAIEQRLKKQKKVTSQNLEEIVLKQGCKLEMK